MHKITSESLAIETMEVVYKNVQKLVGLITFSGVSGVLYYFWRKKCESVQVDEKDVIFITGCDSGFGYNVAIKCLSYGMTVIASFLNLNSEGAKKLQKEYLSTGRLYLADLNVLNSTSITTATKRCSEILAEKKDRKLYGLINNAGVMCFGEFEWQTESMIEKQVSTNLIGTMKVTQAFLPVLRKYKGRIIIVSSHCSLQSLPGLAPYCATKAGLKYWAEALRLEVEKYSVRVINFIPGSFFQSSNLLCRQKEYTNEMRDSFTPEQKEFYGNYFEKYNDYLNKISNYCTPEEIQDCEMFTKFKSSVLDKYPNTTYRHDPPRYYFYHLLFKYAPKSIKDWLILKFVSMPEYKD